MARRNTHRLLRAGVIAASVASLLGAGTGTGAANTDDTAPKVVDLTHEQLQANRTPAATATGAAQEKVQRFVEREARAGRLVRAENLDVISVDLGASGVVGAVIPRSDAIQDMRVVLVGKDHDQLALIGAIFADTAEPDLLPSSTAPGFDGGINHNGMIRTNEACRDLWFDAEYWTYNNADHHVYDCWEKWRDGRLGQGAQWAYNRYTLFDPAQGTGGYKGQLIDATIRSRPWKGYESRVSGGPYSYAPTPSSTCTTYNATIGFPSGSSLGIPSVYCSASISVFPNATYHSFGTDWNGRTTGQVFIDEAFRMTTPTATSPAPIYADYMWMEVQYCTGYHNCGIWNPSQYLKWTDTGW